uniref:Capsid protein n=1 Tax=Torque teno virus TaxID=68887 RepID=X4YI22_9VIRU|nr:ORF1 [Torque teno virus]
MGYWWGRRRRWRRWRRRRRPLRRRRWRRRRRWPRRRRWRWRRRRRRPARRYRGRRRRRRVRRRRRRRQKLVLTQWNPQTQRKCVVRGFLPLFFCGQGAYHRNFVEHMDDVFPKGPSGGGFGSMVWNLEFLYQEFKKHHNKWSSSNRDFDLVRYHGTVMKFYRHSDFDYLVHLTRTPPFKEDLLSIISHQPALMMQNYRCLLVKSYKTHPGGRPYVTVKIKPPRLLTDKWYFQPDFCGVPLFKLYVTLAELRFPICSPQTDTNCVTFLVLDNTYYQFLDNTADATRDKERDTKWIQMYSTTRYHLTTHINTLFTGTRDMQEAKQAGKDSQFRENIWNTQKIIEIITNIANKNMKKQEQYYTKTYGSYASQYFTGKKYWDWRVGLFSPIFLSPSRLNPQEPGAYTEIAYNPWTDEGTGNIVCIQYLTKKDSHYKPGAGSKFSVTDVPLWAALFGYYDQCKKESKDANIRLNCLLLVRCPYSRPKLYNPRDPDQLFVMYSYNFGHGRMPGGDKYVPMEFKDRWYPCMLHQEEVVEELVRCGPFAPKDMTASVTCMARYSSLFTWGGNIIREQAVEDPCKKSTFAIPGAGGLARILQVSNPQRQAPTTTWHSWDWRRSLFTETGLKRMQEQQPYDEISYTGPKRPKLSVPSAADGALAAGGGLFFRDGRQPTSPGGSLPTQTETEAEAQEEEAHQEETEEGLQLQQLWEQQLQQKRELGVVFQHLLRLRQGAEIHPGLV